MPMGASTGYRERPMHVYLLRHGIAEDPKTGHGDASRALTDEGIDKLQRAGPTWKRLVGKPRLVVASPLKRAQQTAALFAAAVHHSGKVRSEAMLEPDGDLDAAVDLLRGEMLDDCDSIVLVGHQPHLGNLLGLLLTGSERCSIPLKKGMLVGVDLQSSASMIGRLVFALSQQKAAELA